MRRKKARQVFVTIGACVWCVGVAVIEDIPLGLSLMGIGAVIAGLANMPHIRIVVEHK